MSRFAVLIPTYDNARTIASVVREARGHGYPVCVVQDGATDGTREVVRDLAAHDSAVIVIEHERNRGKGAALASGLRELHRRELTHAVTLDADGQHAPGEIPQFVAASEAHPEALVLGNRDLVAAGAGRGSRFGRANSNFWTFVETGLRLPDTQSGFRCYPLAGIAELDLKCTGYDFEIEVLIKAVWTGTSVISIPISVRYFQGEERVSHMRPVRDFIRIGHLNAKLVLLRLCLPAPFLGQLCRRAFRDLAVPQRLTHAFIELFIREPGSPRRIALSAGLGVFMGLAPIWGFQIAAALLAAHVLGLSKPVAVLASHISFPLIIPFILYASLVIGRWVLGREAEHASLHLQGTDFGAWVVGSFVLATVCAFVTMGLTYVLLISGRFLGRGRHGS